MKDENHHLELAVKDLSTSLVTATSARKGPSVAGSTIGLVIFFKIDYKD